MEHILNGGKVNWTVCPWVSGWENALGVLQETQGRTDMFVESPKPGIGA